jgi:MoaA/NifB/PqqE/SkfB family radical SAM enzyme
VLLWALFFLIPVGRAQADQGLAADEIEEVLRWAANLQPRVPFGIKTTEAPQYHRVLGERARPAGGSEGAVAAPERMSAAWGSEGASSGPPHTKEPLRAGRAVTDGNGFVFVDHLGNICPSGFLPLPAGNVRRDDLVAVYRDHPLFVSLRDPARLGGRCGRCEWRGRCGGSRARAYALHGDPLAEDPGCVHEPAVRESGT